MNTGNRYIRQQELFSEQGVNVAVVGVGAVGRNVVLQLTAMGVKNITIVDFDAVEVENLAAQGFYEGDLEKSKVEAVKDAAALINSEVTIHTRNGLYRPEFIEGADVVFCCLDSMEGRQKIFKEECQRARLILDSRMSGEYFEIIRIDPSKKSDLDYYMTTLFKDSEAYQERCTSKTTIYCASITAGFLISEMVKFLRGVQLTRHYAVQVFGSMIVDMEAKKNV
jgi:sulfur carrier protein ThiS adenylyltransferase